MSNKALRIPRPLGITNLMNEYHNTGSAELISNISRLLTQQWMSNGGNLFGRLLTIYDLSNVLGCEVSVIHNQLSTQMLNSGIWDKEKREAVTEQIVGTTIAWALEDRLEIDHQTNILKQAQGSGYKPFITAELQKMLGLKVTSNNSLQNLIGKLTSGNTINNILNQQNNLNLDETQSPNVTIEDAVIIIQEQLQANNHSAPDYVLENIDTTDLPEVRAKKQIGLNVDKEGLNYNKQELIQVIDNYQGAKEESDIAHHELRREIEENIDPDIEQEDIAVY